ncbi:mediator of RNA polymerase II transcription subunit 12 isoform X2 [Drosophila hydei]|uniref:Mediator of RNA polymerase II transcription subunit 12 isoform X2 n=1 Tax=Drosophila hydei TaxID=7224 RepID=A0A6J2SY17_DROHY|nr:mediator of RNA polymerase II transcription subunit 12 isoform X2 [Drosophila hydei]
MFFSLAQTLVCVLLINGGLYALHLSGNSEKQAGASSSSALQPGSGSGSSLPLGAGHVSAGGAWQSQPQQQLHQHAGGGAPPGGGLGHGHGHRSAAAAAFDATTGRLNKEIADMAQLERERLMLLGLAKQTAESPDTPAGHHGRPIIAGRVKMQPSEELDVSDYSALMQQAARDLMFGSVQKQPPPPMATDMDYEQLRELGRRPVKYDYGRVMQPSEHELESETLYEPLHGFGDFDDFSELEQNSDDPHVGEDELLRELDTYQYHGLEEEPLSLPENPYRLQEQLDLDAPETLQKLLEQQELQRDAPAKSNQKTHSLGNYNIRMQQKWARKRAQVPRQQQPALQRNIFGQHFKQQRGKLALANSEATASKHLKAATRSGGSSSSSSSSSANVEKSAQNENGDAAKKQPHESSAATVGDAQQQQKQQPSSSSSSSSSSASSSQQQSSQQEQNKKESDPSLMLPNHKRSGNAASAGLSGYTSPPVSHSIASQLMLRTARGQRQYDVPQIGEYREKLCVYDNKWNMN